MCLSTSLTFLGIYYFIISFSTQVIGDTVFSDSSFFTPMTICLISIILNVLENSDIQEAVAPILENDYFISIISSVSLFNLVIFATTLSELKDLYTDEYSIKTYWLIIFKVPYTIIMTILLGSVFGISYSLYVKYFISIRIQPIREMIVILVIIKMIIS